MSSRGSSSGPKGHQPEALNTFAAASRSGSVKPKDQGASAKADTAPKAKNLSKKHRAAADVLETGAKKQPRTIKAAKSASER
jgi:hypothetical protein